MAILYGLSINTRDYAYEEAWKAAGVKYTSYSVGSGSAEWRFPNEAEKNRAREIAAREIIQDFDVDDDQK